MQPEIGVREKDPYNRVSHISTFFSGYLATSPSVVHWSKQRADFFVQNSYRSSSLPGSFSNFVLDFEVKMISNDQPNKLVRCIADHDFGLLNIT